MPDSKIDSLDVASLERSVNDSATRVSTIWLSFVVFQAYLAAAAANVSHRQIFLEDPIKLPTINIDLPLVASAILLPLLFVIYHIFVLLQIVLLARTADAYNEALEHGVSDALDQTRVRQRLANTLFAQMFAGSPREREGLLGWLVRLMAWITLAVAPALVLLVFEVKFLPYHSAGVTWTHRILIALDLLAVLLLWAGAITPRRDVSWRTVTRGWKTTLGAAAVVAATCFLVTYPGELHTMWMRHLSDTDQPSSAAAVVPEGDEGSRVRATWIDSPECRTPWIIAAVFPPFFDRLSLAGATFVDPDTVAKVSSAADARGQRPDKVERTRNLAERDLRCATLSAADLRYADLSRARMSGARLDSADLRGARLEGTDLAGASLAGTQLEGASLHRAQLQGTYLVSAQLQGARLVAAQLQAATLDEARLDGADLTHAESQGASLARAHLRGARLAHTGLQYATLVSAQLQGASLTGTTLDDAELAGAQWQGADIVRASFQRTNLTRADFQGASIDGAEFRGTLLIEAQLQGASLNGSSLADALIAETLLWRVANFDCDNARVVTPRFEPIVHRGRESRRMEDPSLSLQDLGRFMEKITQGMPKAAADKMTEELRSRFGTDAKENETDQRSKRVWTYCADATTARGQDKYGGLDEQYRGRRIALLIDLACKPDPAQPHIATGIYRSSFEGRNLPAAALSLLGEAGKPCPGARQLARDIKTKLRKIAGRSPGK
jgi:uncharacterized protein YjbI with pentapeptide repeats